MASSWNIIREGSRGVLLAVDFSRTARPEAGFEEFSSLLDPQWGVWLTRQPDAAPSTVPGGKDYLAAWTREVEDSGITVGAVLGYCVGSVFAARIGEYAERDGTRPPVVLVDPEPPTRRSLIKDFTRATSQFSSLFSAPEQEERHRTVQRWADECEVFRAFGAALDAEFRSAAEQAFIRAGVAEATRAEYTEELGMRFASLISYNVAAFETDAEPEWSDQVVVRSSGPESWPTPDTRQVRFDVSHSDILRTETVADFVASLLA
ncbi:MAG TPA: hypothetical protein VGM10_28330 [Actinocrinis sp.]|jgi:hypothetical protein